MEKRYKIAAAVILYNPQPSFYSNICLYQDDIDVIYVLDNSEKPSLETKSKVSKLAKTIYVPHGENLGIAKALNIGAAKAIEQGYNFLLTMDQDSLPQRGMIQAMLECMKNMESNEIGIVSPIHVYPYSEKGKSGKPCENALTVMTSGNLLNLKAYQKVGPFLEKLFIDHVDDEYCMRLRQRGFKIIRAGNARLKHHIGDITEHRFFSKRFAISNHPPLRRYYAARNIFYLRKHYKKDFPDFFRYFLWKFLREIGTIVLYERDKLKKLSFLARGYLDYKRDKYGKYTG